MDLKSGNVTAGLDGNALNSFTAQPDIGRFVAYVLTNLPVEKLEWQIFRIEAERKVRDTGPHEIGMLTGFYWQSFNQIFKEYEERTGKKLNVTYRSESELKKAIKDDADLASLLQLDWGLGWGLVGPLDQLSVSEYPDWNPKTVADVLYS